MHKVTPEIFRGPRPESVDLIIMKEAGFSAVLNLDNNITAMKSEHELCKELGLAYFINPMSEYSPPSVEDLLSVTWYMKILSRPLYVHCRRGKDRTGIAVAAFRIAEFGWDAHRAYGEMLAFGHSRLYEVLGWKRALFKFHSFIEEKARGPNK